MSESTPYRLRSVRTGSEFDDTGWMLDPPGEREPSLIRAIYGKQKLDVKDGSFGLYRFADWLPVRRFLKGSSAPVTWKSKGLANALKLDNLWITFSGFWPDKGAMMRTCSFKETEAYSVCGRLDPSNGKVLVVASAGNTARAFARVCSDNNIPLLLCMPYDTLDAMWFDEPVNPCVRLAVTESGSDYFDAINLSNLATTSGKFLPEGGAKNVARRDGMGTTVLSAATTMGAIPDWYFQAVGSGTGAIAAWEANLRLIGDGRFGNRKMKLMVSQNCPFTPMADAWKRDARDLSIPSDDHARKQVSEIIAKVLSNRKPPYGITGGLYDAMKDAGGDFTIVTNDELHEASELFSVTEGIDIHPAAAVAVASLMKAVSGQRTGKGESVMINITGGGESLMKKGRKLHYLKPSVTFGISPSQEEVAEKLNRLFSAG
jgi:cysteate synthase